jgi:2-dehydropantoate 2-reductase
VASEAPPPPQHPAVAVLGAGSIGCFVGGTLAAAGWSVVLIGRPDVRDEIAAHGLTLTDRGAPLARIAPGAIRVETGPGALVAAAVVLVATKHRGLAEAAREIAVHARPDAVVVPLLNGVGVAESLAAPLAPRPVRSGIVTYNVAKAGPAHWQKTTMGAVFVARHPALAGLAAAGIALVEDMRPIEWGKLLLNLTNAVNALSGLPLRATLEQSGYRRVLAAAIEEAMAVARAERVVPDRLGRPIPRHWMPPLMRLPDWLFNRLVLPTQGIAPNARLSMTADYDAGRETEIDALNGAVVSAAARHGLAAPVNAGLVRLVEAGDGRHWTAAELAAELLP